MPSLTLRRAVFGLAALATLAALVLYETSPGRVAGREREAKREAARLERGSGDVAGTSLPPPALHIEALRVAPGGADSVARVSGLLEPIRRVTLSAQVSGAIAEVLADEHERVEANATLVRLDATPLRAALDRARAGLIRAQAAQRLAKLELERHQNLSQRNFVSTAELDRAVNQERASFAALGEARATVVEARDRLAKSEIRAPFAGTVNWLDLEPGSYLSPGDRVAELLDLSAIELEVGVTDHQVVALAPGDAIEVHVDVYPGETFAGSVAHVGRSADDQSQRYPVEIHVPNPEERLLPGMVAQAVLSLGGDETAIHIPRRATLREYELDYVYVLDRDGGDPRVERRRVSLRPVPFRPDRVEVVAGLAVGEEIAVSSVHELRDGLRVRATQKQP